jgi:phage baseplate assembly protein W
MRNIAYPFAIDGRGRTAETDYATHVRELVEQVLFTAAGERVMRPDFGCGLAQLVFAPNGPELAAATQFLVQGALQRFLADAIDVTEVAVSAQEAVLRIEVAYRVRSTGEVRSESFERSAAR